MKRLLSIGALLVAPWSGLASDHIDGPVTTQHRIGDISDFYAFPSPKDSNKLVLKCRILLKDCFHNLR